MLAQRNPQAAYQQVAFDARISGADPAQLVDLCYEQLIMALGSALLAAKRGDNRTKSAGLTRAVAALTALQLGISGAGPLVDALNQLYGSARRAVLDSVLRFDPARLEHIRSDFVEIARVTGHNQTDHP